MLRGESNDFTCAHCDGVAQTPTCKEIYADHRATLADLHQIFAGTVNAAAMVEFPIGASVAWRMPGHGGDVKGHVTGHIEGETASVMVRATGGMGATIHAWNLTKLEEAKG
jgi:hypothetical protein